MNIDHLVNLDNGKLFLMEEIKQRFDTENNGFQVRK